MTSSTSSSGANSPASLLLRSKSAPAKIQIADEEDEDRKDLKKSNFIVRTIFAPILFLSFIFSLAIVDRKRSLEEDRQHGHLSKRRRLLYFSLFWRIPKTPKTDAAKNNKSSSIAGSEDGGRRGSEGSETKMEDIHTLSETQKEARSMSAEAFSIQNRVMLGMGVFSIAFGMACWVTYLKVKEFLGFA